MRRSYKRTVHLAGKSECMSILADSANLVAHFAVSHKPRLRLQLTCSLRPRVQSWPSGLQDAQALSAVRERCCRL